MTSTRMDIAPPVTLVIDGTQRVFDIDEPALPDWVVDKALASGGYPYDAKLDKGDYKDQLEALQLELVKVQYWMQETGERVVLVFEGRDSAGKGGTIKKITEYMNPRVAHVVALPKPTDREQGEWYFQRYVRHLPSTGEMRLFDRSWYNRAGVEPVMGYCSAQECAHFLDVAPEFEDLIVREGIHFFKFWLNIGQEMQLKRFHDRRHDPLKIWKLSPMDIEALTRWEAYTKARERMLEATHRPDAPWTVIKANDKRRLRINAIRHVLHTLDYDGKDETAIGKIDDTVLMPADSFLASL